MVGVMRRYSRRGDLWRVTKKVDLILTRRVARTEPIVSNTEHPVHRIDVRMDTQQIQALVRDYEAGTETSELQHMYGLSKGSIRKLLADAQVVPHRQLVPSDVAERCVAFYNAGLTIREVGSEVNLPKSTVRGLLLRADVTMRPAQRRR